jgi:predicted Zn-dependent protease with MMP-like domain
MRFSKQTFEKYISEALESLPERFKRQLVNLAVTIDEEGRPSKGNSITLANIMRSTFYPSKITYFKLNIESVSPNEAALRQNLRHVTHHEIGHYFWMSEEQIRKKERKRGVHK